MSVEMLKLTANSVVADELELSTLNSGLGLFTPSGRWATYNTPMDGVRKASAHDIVFQAREGSPELNCCSVNAARGLGMVSDWAVMRDAKGLFLNWYGPGKINVPILGPAGQPHRASVTLTQSTDYPRDGRILIAVDPTQPTSFTLRLRIPYWSQRSEVLINGKALTDIKPGRYAEITRTWSSGDRIELTLDLKPHGWVGERECAGKTSVFCGPLLLTWDRRFNSSDPESAFKLNAIDLPGRMVKWTGLQPPIALWEIRTPAGTIVRLCDFASAGHGGSPYRSWLDLDGFKPTEFSRANPLRSSAVR